MKKTALMTVGALAIVTASGLALAGGKYCDNHDGYGKHGGKFGGEHKIERMAKYLELTDEQKQSIEKLFADKKQEGEGHRELRQQFREDLHALDPKSPSYLDDVKALADKKSGMMAEKMVDMAEMKMELYAVLTPEQITKLEQMKERKSDHGMGKHHGEYGGKHHW